MSATSIINCTCDHKEQDRMHGKGKRVHNQSKKGSWVCTVCKSAKK